MERTRTRNLLAAGVALGALAVGYSVVIAPEPAQAHGAFTYPASRTYACFQDATNGSSGGALAPTNPACVDALAEGGDYAYWNWFGNLISNSDGRHREFVADGELCGPTPQFSAFNAARDDWPSTTLEAGTTVEFLHNAWAPHPGSFFTYVTEPGWDPNQPLTWDDLELIDTAVNPPLRSGGEAGAEYYWDVDLPDRSGRHVIYSVWERSDSPEAFYNCSDVVFEGDGDPGPTDPPDPTDPPEPTDPPDPTDPPTDPPAEDYCTAEYRIVNEWSGGFQAEVELTAGEEGVDGWMVDWVFANGQTVSSLWNGTVVNHGSHHEVRNMPHNSLLDPGESTTFGFTADHPGGVNIVPLPDCGPDA